MTQFRASSRSPRALIRVAIVVIGALAVSLSSPLPALANEGVVVYQLDAAEYSIQVVRDSAALNLTMTNNSADATTVGIGADLTTVGVTERLWMSDVPILADLTQRKLEPGASVTESAPFLPGVTVTFYRSIETSAEEIGTYRTPGAHIRFAWTSAPTPDDPDASSLEFGPIVSVLPGPIVPGGGVGIGATGLATGVTTAYIDVQPALDVVGDEYVATPSSEAVEVGSGTVAPDGSVLIRGMIPAGTAPGEYTVLFRNGSGFGAHFSTSPLTVMAGTPSDVHPGTVVLVGTAAIGSVVRAQSEGWTPSGVTFLYSWAADGVAIPGAISATYKVKPAQPGTALSVTVTGWAVGYSARSVTSEVSDIVPANSFSEVLPPTISGLAIVGEKLLATAPLWTPSARFSYQWSVEGVSVGTDSRSYTPAAADVGKIVAVSVTGSRVGYTTAISVSAESQPVAPGVLQVPATRPAVKGQERVGGTLTLILGTWKPAPTFTIQWLANGVPIAGEHGMSLIVPASLDGESFLGAIISAEVTATSPGYTTVVRSASADAPIALGVFAPKGAPTILGTPVVGEILTVDAGQWSPTPELSYQWNVAGVIQPGEVGTTFAVPMTAHNKKISVVVTAARDGFTSVTETAVTADKVP